MLPLLALLVRAPWREPARQRLSDPRARQALRLSLVCATCGDGAVPAAGRAAGLGAGAGARSPAARSLRALVTVPLVLPPVVGGVALLLLLGRRGLLGRYLDSWFGSPCRSRPPPSSSPRRSSRCRSSSSPSRARCAAPTAATRTPPRRSAPPAGRCFRRVTLPLVAPGVTAGAVLCFARALGEFGATITFAGSFPGVTRTMPIEVYLALETDPDAAVVLSLVLLAVSVAGPGQPARPVADGQHVRERWTRSLRVPARRRSRSTSPLRGRRPATVLALLGPNGAGKSTALRALAGLRPSTAAASTLAGRPRRSHGTFVRPRGRGRHGLPGLPAVPAPVSARQRRLRAAGAERAQGAARQQADAWLHRMGLAERPTPRPAHCPAGRPSASRWPARWPPTRAAAARRAALGAGRRHPHGGAQRPAPAPGRLRRLHGAGHPRPARRHGPGRPPRRARARPDRAAGPPGEVARAPRTDYVARLVGLNLYRGTAAAGLVPVHGGGILAPRDPRRRRLPGLPAVGGRPAPPPSRPAPPATSGPAASPGSSSTPTPSGCAWTPARRCSPTSPPPPSPTSS